jgi:hypothetical protein
MAPEKWRDTSDVVWNIKRESGTRSVMPETR